MMDFVNSGSVGLSLHSYLFSFQFIQGPFSQPTVRAGLWVDQGRGGSRYRNAWLPHSHIRSDRNKIILFAKKKIITR